MNMAYDKLDNLSPEQRATFEQLKSIIMKDYGVKEADDEQVYRFLKARDFDITQSEKMLRNHIEWRRNMKEISKTFKKNELQQKLLRLVPRSHTKEGLPVIYVDCGNVDFKGLLKSVKLNDIVTALAIDILDCEEHLDIQSKKLGRRINQWCTILDFGNFHISQVLHKPNIELYLKMFSTYEANFPERLKTDYTINASSVFLTIFNIIKPLLSANTLSKVNIFAADGWKEALLKEIDEQELPKFLGGKKVGADGSPFCDEIKPKEPVPKSCYFRSAQRRLRGKQGVREYILKRNDTCEIDLRVYAVGSKITWSFETEKGDIAYGLFLKEKSAITKTLLPIKTINAHIELEERTFLCEENGTYILKFDNTHSWMREKQIFCKVAVIAPDEEEKFVTC